MSLLKRILIVIAWAIPSAANAVCDVEFEANFARLVEAEAALGRAEAGLQGYAAGSPARAGIRSGIESERASVDALLDEFTTKGKLNTGKLAEIEARVFALREATEAPPVRYVIGDHLGNPRKTPLPDDAEAVFATAVPEPGRTATWWGYNGTDFYRYQGSVVGDVTHVHFNGSTSLAEARSIAVGDVPKEIRRFFGVR